MEKINLYCNLCEKETKHYKNSPTDIERKIIEEASCQIFPLEFETYRCGTCNSWLPVTKSELEKITEVKI